MNTKTRDDHLKELLKELLSKVERMELTASEAFDIYIRRGK